jgi:MoaA/NifB/PqqE/SkfB family radical SAM enzyme
MEIYETNNYLSKLYRIRKRLFNIFIRNHSWKKLRNFLSVETQKRLRRTLVKGYPYVLYVEPASVCNLKCPGCLAYDEDYHKTFLGIDDFRKVIDKYKDYLYDIELYSWGEPFLNKDIFEMIRYAKRQRIFVRTSTNFNTATEKDIEEIVTSGLDQINISIDGITEETYQIYRIGGKLSVVLNNLNSLVNKKKELESKTPIIEWQFIVSRYNEHEIPAVKRMARETGVDILRLDLHFSLVHINKADDNSSVERWLPRDKRYRVFEKSVEADGFAYNAPCCYLWSTLVINSQGRLNLCPNRIGSIVDCGDPLEKDPKDLWNGDIFTHSRELFAKNGDIPNHRDLPCAGCTEFAQPWKILSKKGD